MCKLGWNGCFFRLYSSGMQNPFPGIFRWSSPFGIRLAVLLSILVLTGLDGTEVHAAITLASDGKARAVILTQPGATPAERHAAKELAYFLNKITGADFTMAEAGTDLPSSAILVGPGPAARSAFPEIPWDDLKDEERVIKTKDGLLLLAGGRPRGTLYAVYGFLQDAGKVRWWTPWATHIPADPALTIPALDIRERPAFEARDPFWYPAFDRDWAVRNYSNSQHAHLTPELGGCIRYKGFVHTFYPLVPPEKHFTNHPEWFSLLKGRRTHERGQLCLTNPKLREFMVERVKQELRASPDAAIISVSQNDWYGACECDNCKALDTAEDSHAGTMLSLVNEIAEKIAPEFPQVAVDTLAYQYTRQAPRTLVPRTNVIVRLCSIECDFSVPLDHPSNAAFAKDLRDWSRISQRLYIWDYTTDFAHYIQPHPNWFVLGPNLRFFKDHHVAGMFEQGAYQSQGSEMAEMRAWVLARLLWNPRQDDRALIREFLEGYYGAPAARHILEYMELMTNAAKGYKMTCYAPSDAPYLRFETLSLAESLWRKAEEAADSQPEQLWRVRISHLPVQYVWLSQWSRLRKEWRESGKPWPISNSRKELAESWLALANAPGPSGWSKITHLNEPGLTPAKFMERVGRDSED